MSNRIGIELEHVTLDVPTYHQKERSARHFYANLVAAAFDRPVRSFRRLIDDVNLQIRPGDRLAVLGRNGAGKSTLLRLLAGAYTPTSGRIEVHGRLQALLNISLGFNQDATLKENIYLRGAAMGMSIRQCHAIVKDVLEFSGLADRAGDRLKVLSAGQKMRLGFSITTELESDILVMDEWIGTGDAEFFTRAQARLKGKLEGAKIVVLASHSVPLLKTVCNRAIYMENGAVVADGSIDDVVARHIPQPAAAKRQ
jgi:ABC-type polysaccharide/polyol phosphate transport system ATPase subunit